MDITVDRLLNNPFICLIHISILIAIKYLMDRCDGTIAGSCGAGSGIGLILSIHVGMILPCTCICGSLSGNGNHGVSSATATAGESSATASAGEQSTEWETRQRITRKLNNLYQGTVYLPQNSAPFINL